MISDPASGPEVVLGSHRWVGLARYDSLSALTTGPGVVASVSRYVADMIERTNRPGSSYNPTRLRNQADDLDEQGHSIQDEENNTVFYCGTVEDQHYVPTLARSLRIPDDRDKECAVFFVDRWNDDISGPGFTLAERWCNSGHNLSVVSSDQIPDSVSKRRAEEIGVKFRCENGFRGSAAVIGENLVFIGSFDWFGKPTPPTDHRNFGMWVSGPGARQLLKTHADHLV